MTSKGMSWPQVSDADKKFRKLFNVKGTPTYYLDREGKIAAKDIPFKKTERRYFRILERGETTEELFIACFITLRPL